MGMRVAVIGTGYWGTNHVRTLSALRDGGADLDLVVCDVDHDRAHTLAEAHDASATTDPHSLLKGEGIVDAVTIATPSPLHAEQARMFLSNGIATLVEKPMALSIDESRQVANIAAEHGALLSVGHVFRHHSGVREAARLVAAGEIGPVRLIESVRTAVREPRPDMGAIHALGIHDYDIFSFIMNDQAPLSIQASATPSYLPGIEDHAVTLLTFSQSDAPPALAVSTVGWRSRIDGKQRRLRIIGRDASLDVDYLDHSGLWIHHHPSEQIGTEWGGTGAAPRERLTLPLGEPALTAELRHFLSLVENGTQHDPITGGEVGVRGVEMVERALSTI